MKTISLTVMALLILGLTSINAQGIDRLLSNLDMTARLGYNIGGTAPVGLPATIRSLDRYTLQPNASFGVDVGKKVAGRFGIMAGIHLENKGMETDARVKNYHMRITNGGETLEGMFTGNVVTEVGQWMVTFPVQATMSLNDKLMLRLGPYASYVISHSFEGNAYGGYLRVDDPTGQKVEIGTEPDTRGLYDFADYLRRMQYGVDLGVDWQFHRNYGVYASLMWGLNGVFHSSFHTIEQTLYPIYGTVGLTYRIK
ncbi:MAG: porin family protein [Prevotella sp.]